jgi:hypothetical protein
VKHYIGTDLQAQFAAKLVPFHVVDGPEIRPTTTGGRERVVIEHDLSGGDSFAPTHTPGQKPPRTRLTRVAAYKVTIYAKSPTAGAAYWEHEQRAEAILDQVLVGLDLVAKMRANVVQFRSGKFVFPADLKASETPGFATYELFFTFDRGVTDAKWDGTTVETIVIPEGMIKNTVVVDGAETLPPPPPYSLPLGVTDDMVGGETIVFATNVASWNRSAPPSGTNTYLFAPDSITTSRTIGWLSGLPPVVEAPAGWLLFNPLLGTLVSSYTYAQAPGEIYTWWSDVADKIVWPK